MATAAGSMGLAEQPGPEAEVEETEAFRALCDIARTRFGAIPASVLARHVLAVTRDADWPVQRAAMEALLRRYSFARRDALKVARRPAGGGPLGLYATKGKGSSRPYRTLLGALEPLVGSCDCPDFLRSSLGLCKHLLVVLADVHGDERRLQRARRMQKNAAARGMRLPNGAIAPAGDAPRLIWDPVRPLVGEGDWLERLMLVVPRAAGGRGAPGDRASGRGAASRACESAAAAAAAAARRLFVSGGGGDVSVRVLRATHAGSPKKRLELVERLLELVGGANGAARAEGETPFWESDPPVEALLRAEAERLRRRLTGEEMVKRLPGALRSMRRRLYPYQLEGVRTFVGSGRLLLADDMGLGKTAQAIAACHSLFRDGRIRRGLLLVPASLKPQWLREWALFSDCPAQLVDGNPAQRAAIYEQRADGFLIANYEQVLRDLALMRRYQPEIVVLDEAQRIKNWETKTAAYVKQLQAPFRLVLTGTPLQNRLDELASLMDWVDDMALEPKWRLGPWHQITADGRRGATGARNLETLRARIGHCMLRRLRSEVLDQLPSRTDVRVPVELEPEQQAAHDELNLPIARLLAAAARRPLTQAEFLRLMMYLNMQRMICNGLAQKNFESIWPAISGVGDPAEPLLRSLGSPKLYELRELVAALAVEQGRKIVIFSQWRRMLQLASWAVGGVLSKAGLRAVFFTGQEPQRRRTQNIVDFHDDPRTCVLFATDAGGVGLNLQRAASCCINIELPWNPAVLEQRVGRIHRLGQQQPIDCYFLVSESGIEARLLDLVGNKRALFTGLFDGTSDEVRFEGVSSFLARVEKLYEADDLASLVAAGAGGEDGDEGEATDAAEAAELAEEAEAAEEAVAGVSLAEAAGAAARTTAPELEEAAAELEEAAAELEEAPDEAARRVAAGGATDGTADGTAARAEEQELGAGVGAGAGAELGAQPQHAPPGGEARSPVRSEARAAEDGEAGRQVGQEQEAPRDAIPGGRDDGVRVALPTLPMAELANVLSRVAVRPGANGGVTIEAPAEAAAALASLLQGIARQLAPRPDASGPTPSP